MSRVSCSLLFAVLAAACGGHHQSPAVVGAEPPPAETAATESAAADPRPSDGRETAWEVVKMFAYEAYPQWYMKPANTDRCPTVEDLVEYLPDASMTRDPWGHEYRILCGADRPASVRGIGVFSSGPDGQADSDDDVRSWAP